MTTAGSSDPGAPFVASPELLAITSVVWAGKGRHLCKGCSSCTHAGGGLPGAGGNRLRLAVVTLEGAGTQTPDTTDVCVLRVGVGCGKQ